MSRFPANELWGNGEPKCPYCGENWETEGEFYDGYHGELECGSCSKKFIVQCRYSIEYDTVGDCRANGELPHELKKGYFKDSAFECQKCRSQFYKWELDGGQYQKLNKEDYKIISEKSTLEGL